eukprot:3332329-Prymnesium_polylepis.3
MLACWSNAVRQSNDVPASAHAAADELSRRRAGRYSRAGRLGTLSRAGSTASTPELWHSRRQGSLCAHATPSQHRQ